MPINQHFTLSVAYYTTRYYFEFIGHRSCT